MPLVLPESHPAAGVASDPPTTATRDAEARARPVRIGIINIMPKLEAYEPLLLGPLSRVPELVEPVFIRLESHTYQSSDQHHIERFYGPFDAAVARAPLAGLIGTGAPVA